MRFYGDGDRVLRSRLLAGAIVLSGSLWALEGFWAGEDRLLELLLALFLAHAVWVFFGRKRTDDPEVAS